MNRYISVETPGGKIWAEIEESGEAGLQLTGAGATGKVFRTFEEATDALKRNAQHLLNKLKDLGAQEMEVSFGIRVGAEAGTPLFGLAKASGDASFTVKLKWKSGQQNPTEE